MAEDMQSKTINGPDLDHPHWVFRDGPGLACVRPMPVAAPTWGSRDARYGGEEALTLIVVVYLRELWWRRALKAHDDRWKVVVSRSRRRVPALFRTVALDFCETLEAAEARQVALLRDWSTARYAETKPLTRRERRRLRLASL